MLIDITRPIHPNMAIYPGNPAVKFSQTAKAGSGSSALTEITLGSHTGTHIDAPSHIDPDGGGTDIYDLENMIGGAEVADLTAAVNTISVNDLPATKTTRVIVKTKNSTSDIDEFNDSFVALDESAAKELVRRQIKLVGIDGWSIKKKGVKDAVHKILLDAGVVILEGLWLADVAAGRYKLICLPLPVVNLDGVPVRAVLETEND